MFLQVALIGLVAFVLGSILREIFRPGLADIPGPFFAKFTSLWRLYTTWQRTFQYDIPRLHEKYNSTLIRLSPDMISCTDPRVIDRAFGFHNEMQKSDLVKPTLPIFKGKKQITMFAAADNKTHARLRRPVASAFAMTSVIRFEPVVDQNLKLWMSQMERLFIKPRKAVDFHNWAQYFTFDVITEMTMSRSFGLIKVGGDVDGLMSQMQKEMDYRGLALAMPGMDDFVRLNPLQLLFNPHKTQPFAARSRQIMRDRLDGKDGCDQVGKTKPPDFTHKFLEAQTRDPSIPEGQLIGYMQGNLLAGNDTTAIAIRTAVYYAMKNPWIMHRMRAELDAKHVTYPVSFKVAYYELPFCAAVVREALRFHFPIVGLMERLIPKEGLELPDGKRLPGGTVIGMQPDLIGRDKNIFGPDADAFNPLRWLQADGESAAAFEERLRDMNRNDLSFGYGPRACIGKHVAELEVYKFVTTFFGVLEPSFLRLNQKWRVRSLFINKQEGMDMHLAWRQGVSLGNLQCEVRGEAGEKV